MWRWLRGAKPHFDVQVRAAPGRPELSAADQRRATEHVVTLLLRGCGLLAAPGFQT